MRRRSGFVVLFGCTLLLAAACTTGSSAADTTPDPGADAVAPDAPADALPDPTPDAAEAEQPESLAEAEQPESLAEAVADPTEAVADAAEAELPEAPAEVVADTSDAVDAAPEVVSACSPSPRPVIFVHGVNGSSANYATMIARLVADGWPAEYLFAFDAADPKWGCNVDNAAAIQQLVEHARTVTGHERVDLVAHSMGTLSSRYYVKNLGGTSVVNTYVTMGGMHHGLSSPCWSPFKPCVWDELCENGEFIAQLNADPATPGNLHWVSIYGTADETVPNESSYLEGAENIALEGIEHDGPNGLQERLEAYEEVKRVLSYPCW